MKLLDKVFNRNEKKARIYYHNIVYEVCCILDKELGVKPGTGIICGTVDNPSTETQEVLKERLQVRKHGTKDMEDEKEQAKSALAWVREQAKRYNVLLSDNESVGHCTRILVDNLKQPKSETKDLTVEEVRKWLCTDEKFWFWHTSKDTIMLKSSLWKCWRSMPSPFKAFDGTWYKHCSKIHPITGEEA